MTENQTTANPRKDLPQGLKMLLEFGPLIAFFVANWLGGIFVATVAIMVATPLTLGITWYITRKWSVMPIVTLVFVAVFGGLTLYLHNETFIKVKVTIINIMFGAILLIGLALKKPLLKLVFGEAMNLDAEGWRKMTLNWGLFFFALAAINEVVWRSMSTDNWVTFKTFGILPLTFLFTFTQIPVIQRHMIDDTNNQE